MCVLLDRIPVVAGGILGINDARKSSCIPPDYDILCNIPMYCTVVDSMTEKVCLENGEFKPYFGQCYEASMSVNYYCRLTLTSKLLIFATQRFIRLTITGII